MLSRILPSILSSNWRRCFKVSLTLILVAFCHVSGGIVDSCRAEGISKIFEGKSYAVYRVDLERQQLELWSRDNTGARLRNAGEIKAFAAALSKRLIFATNAGIFDQWFTPLGLYVEKRREVVPLNTKSGPGNFYLKPNGVFALHGREGFILGTDAYNAGLNLDYATQSGPLLVIAGSINSAFDPNSKNRLVRSGVGVRGKSEVLFAISNEPVSFYEFAALFRDGLGCRSALYLDGVISGMYALDLQREQTSGDFAAMFTVFDEPAANATVAR